MSKRSRGEHGALVSPLYLGIAHELESIDQGAAIFGGSSPGFAYARMGNPNVTECEEYLTELEGAKGGRTWATSTGLSALQLLVLSMLAKTPRKRRRIITSPYIYGGSYHQFQLWRDKFDFKIVFVEDPFDLTSWEEAIGSGGAFVFLETPGNPTVDVFDIAGVAEIAHAHNTPLVVDNTVAVTLQKPLELDADAVMLSVTKAPIGQSVGLGGAIVGTQSFVEKFGDMMDEFRTSVGGIMHPMSAWFTVLNRANLPMQMERCSKNAMRIAIFLESRKFGIRINYPFLPSGPEYALAKEQMDLGGGLLSFELKDFETARAFVELSESTLLVPHLGHMSDHLVIHPASTTHSQLSEEELATVKIGPGLVRMSVGLEDPKEVLEDFGTVLSEIYA